MRRTTRISDSFATPSRRRRIFGRIGVLASAALIAALAGCSSGDGGDNGHGDMGDAPGVTNPGKAGGLTFTYPSDGQQDVYAQTQIALTFAGDVSDDADHLTLVAHPGQPNEQAVATDVTQDGSQPGIFRLQVAGQGNSVERPALQPDTKYAVEATGDIGAGNTQYKNGDTLFAFTTRPASNSPSPKGFTMVGHRGDSNDPFPFTAFNTIRLTLSEPVNPATAIKGDTVSVTDSGGMNVPGRMVADGRHISFDPNQNLKAGETYTVSLSKGNRGEAVQSIFGDALSGDHSFKLEPVSVGNSVKQNVVIEPTSNNAQSLPANNLNGGAANVVSLVSELVGRNMLPAQNDPQRRSLLTVLAGTTSGDRYNNTFPAIIPAGQEFNLTPLNLKLGGAITTPIQSGPLVARFIDAADVFITANSLRNVKTPTAVHLRFDVAIGSDIQGNDQNQIVANGAVNQTVMNVVASGLAVPQDNGDIKLTTLGSFPTAVNRNGKAITDFELELTLRAGSQDDIRNQPDSSQPFITAQYPSACLYTYGAQFNDFFMDTGLDSVALESTENDCAANSPPLTEGPRTTGDPAGVDNFRVNQNPSITFSEPIDPTSLAPHDSSHLQLTNADGDGVAFTAHTEGSSVVLNPLQPLAHDTRYMISVGNGVTDLAGNTVRSGGKHQFRTSPYVKAEPPGSYTFTDKNGNEQGVSYNNLAQTAPMITAIKPGIPCALDPASGDFRTGGDMAGYCLGDKRDSDTPSSKFPVFKLAANEPVRVQFTKLVKVSSIKLAGDCLTNGSGGSSSGATVAVEHVDGGGKCQGTVPGDLILPHPGQSLTRSFQFVPEESWKDQRYWLVICGNQHNQCRSSAATIVGRDDGEGVKYTNTNGDVVNAEYSGDLNTNPLQGTGTRASTPIGDADLPDDAADGGAKLVNGFRPAGGGPDIVMPFDGAPATRHYSFFANASPLVDINGNGKFDGEVSAKNVNAGVLKSDQPQLERPISANAQYLSVNSTAVSFRNNTAVYQSGAVPNTVLPLSSDCSAAADIIGNTPPQCVPVKLSPGGMFELTEVDNNRNQSQTGRILLRVAATGVSESQAAIQQQTGYIVPECSGTIAYDETTDPRTGEKETEAGTRSYDYSPCFAVSLDLIANAPDAQKTAAFGVVAQNIIFNQQPIHLDLVGPVSFERNGRLVLSLTNTNNTELDQIKVNQFGNIAPVIVSLQPGHSNIQLAGPPIDGGPTVLK